MSINSIELCAHTNPELSKKHKEMHINKSKYICILMVFFTPTFTVLE